ncbi:hypothetical protein DYI24_01030 [Rhodopseudomonas sp. BR0C11]|uniref:hypothetical protein n=1 Tax=Rhodopseudomonas sp. BR0C11 TaxID=2269370 RepID=UPI0013DEE401|nr:hypothetical protein [Rhodopseudomonas sp. BR0C11]NEV75636.1 hypothetical protein [Rhodopseudomonas sp. BR0C11]
MEAKRPDGVHVLSAESLDALARAKAKGDAIVSRHLKPGRLAAASHPDPGRVTGAAIGADF